MRLQEVNNTKVVTGITAVFQFFMLLLVAGTCSTTTETTAPFMYDLGAFVLETTLVMIGYQGALAIQLGHIKMSLFMIVWIVVFGMAILGFSSALLILLCCTICCALLSSVWDGEARGIAHASLLLAIACSVLCCSILMITLLYCCSSSKPFEFFFLGMVNLILSAFAYIWIYVRLLTSGNKWFFRRICLLERKSLHEPEKNGKVEALSKGFFMSVLLAPSESITRINEFITPGIGLYNIETEYEIAIPDFIQKECREIVLPLIIQEKDALLGGLTVRAPSGFTARKMNNNEAYECLKGSLVVMLGGDSDLGTETVRCIAKELAEFVTFESSLQDDGAFKDRCDHIVEMSPDLKQVNRDIVETILQSFRFVKPVCIVFEPESGSSGVRFGKHISVRAIRDVPLVPVRKCHSVRRWAQDTAYRFFTKRRMMYYFGLGNADRGQSYHLTFSGFEGTYLVDLQLMFLGGKTAFASAEKATITNRYDQGISRLYIRNGRGFSKAALQIAYETRSHRPIQAACGSTTVSLLLLLYLGLSHVFGLSDTAISLSDIALPLTVLTAAGLLSAWEAMEEHRAEEWLWLISVSMSAVSIVAIIHLVLLSQFGFWGFRNDHVFAWICYTALSFSFALLSFLALFEKVKQHGALMDRVPITRSAAERDKKSLDFKAILNQQNNAEDSGSKRSRACERCCNVPGCLDSARRKTYADDIRVYEGLFDEEWPNGWLIPVWSGLQNPYSVPSEKYYEYLRCKMKNNKDDSVALECSRKAVS